MSNKFIPLSSRNLVQLFFAGTSLYIGWRFLSFYMYLETGGLSGSPLRPPAVEAFLPISALVGLRSWLGTGVFDPIHPAGLTILLAVLVISFLFRKAFCSWICPFGLLEEMLGRLGLKVLPRKLTVPHWLDTTLRSVKYVLLFLFVTGIYLLMSSRDAAEYVHSPYNNLADLKMLQFFMNISLTGIVIFVFLFTTAFLFRHFWCRYLCPYGALLGLLGWLSPSRITRKAQLCTNCKACDRACPEKLKPSDNISVVSPECTSCLNCLHACPVPEALEYKLLGRSAKHKYALPIIMLTVFAFIIITAMLTGHWNSEVPLEEVMNLYQYLELI